MTRTLARRKTETRIHKALVPAAGAPLLERTGQYTRLVTDISELLEQARRGVARTANSILTATYWEIGRRIVEFEQEGRARARYGGQLLALLSKDLTAKYGRGFSWRNLYQMRSFYVGWQILQTSSAKSEAQVVVPVRPGGTRSEKCQTLSGQFEARAKLPKSPRNVRWKKRQTPSARSDSKAGAPAVSGDFAQGLLPASAAVDSVSALPGVFPLSWSQYVCLMSVTDPVARAFYEFETVRGGWSVRQLDRQIGTRFYERSLVSKHREDFLARGRLPRAGDQVSIEEAVRDPYLLEFLSLRDEYSENDLEEALVRHLEWFLLELGLGFTFVARQKRIRVGDSWYRIDLLLYHRGLRCLVVIDLKRGTFSHADAGQMNLYLNYVKEHMLMPGESDPVGIILCDNKDEAVVKYATGGIRTKVFASKYLTVLPQEKLLRQEILKTKRILEARRKE